MSGFKYIRLDRLENYKGEIALVVLARPNKLNVADATFFEEIGRMFRDVSLIN